MNQPRATSFALEPPPAARLGPWQAAAITGLPILLWSSQAVYMKFLLQGEVGPFTLSLYRGLGALLLGVLIGGAGFARVRDWRCYLPGLFLATNFIVFNLALRSIDAYLLMVIETTSVLLSIPIDRWLKTPVVVWPPALGLACVGIALLGLDAWNDQTSLVLVGLGFAGLTAVSFALFNCTMKYLHGESNSLVPLMLPIVLCSLPLAGVELSRQSPTWRDTVLALLIVGTLQTGVVYLLWARASRYFSGSTLCQISMLTIPATFLMEWLFIDLPFNPMQIAASTALLLAVGLNTHRQLSLPVASPGPPPAS